MITMLETIRPETIRPSTHDTIKSTRDVLIDAKAILAERGRCQGVLNDAAGRVCTLEAVRLAAGFDHHRAWSVSAEVALTSLAQAMYDQDAVDPGMVCMFNNLHTDDAVNAAFDKAIAAN